MQSYKRYTNDFTERYDSLMNDIISEIKKLTKGKKIDLERNGFEDEAGNDICDVDDNSVYFNGGEDSYPLSALGFFDALCVLETLQELKPKRNKKR